MGVASRVVPVTYINSAAAIKSFVGERGGTDLHLVERRRDAEVGMGAEARRSCSCPISTSAATPR